MAILAISPHPTGLYFLTYQLSWMFSCNKKREREKKSCWKYFFFNISSVKMWKIPWEFILSWKVRKLPLTSIVSQFQSSPVALRADRKCRENFLFELCVFFWPRLFFREFWSRQKMGCGNQTKYFPASFAWFLLLSVTTLYFYYPWVLNLCVNNYFSAKIGPVNAEILT